MPYFQAPDKSLHFIDESAFEYLLPTGSVQITDAQAAAIQSASVITINSLIDSAQAMLDAEAKTKGYDSILSACTYATSTVPKFRDEGQAAVNWRDAVWSKCYQLLSQLQSGQVAMPSSTAEFLSALPHVAWPV